MKPSIQKLLKFFKLEADRGYDNHAVMGGLVRMLDHWVPEARNEGVPEDLIQAIVYRIQDYARLTAKSRSETLEGLIRRIHRSDSDPAKTQGPTITKDAREIQTVQSDTEIHPMDTGVEISPSPQAKEAEELAQAEPVEEVYSQETPISTPEADAPPAQIADPVDLNSPVTVLPGIGPRNSQNLTRLGIYTLRDLLYYIPRRYDDYSQLKPINRLGYREQATVIGTVKSIATRPVSGGKYQRTEAIITDGSGSLRVNWFNQPYLARRLHTGMQISLSGKTEQYLGRLTMNNPDWEALEQQQLSTNRIVPIYRLSAQIAAKWLRRVMNQGVVSYAHRVRDHIPYWIQKKANLMDLQTALTQIHFPDSSEELEQAKNRLSFDEIFFLQLGVLQQKRAWQDRTARSFKVDDTWLELLLGSLPFSLTSAQLKVLKDIQEDLASGRPMNRLVQGDVGSGKTVVAALGIAMVSQSGAQTAIMAPTSILAEQHYKNMLRILATPVLEMGSEESTQPVTNDAPLSPDQIRLLIGATPEDEKRKIREELQDGKIKLVIGTHALIEDPVTFADLQMVVVDEQHRFGVEQRAALRVKGENAHLLVMTATPIPRTLALTIYGDLDLSIIDELPEGRQPISTHVLPPSNRERAYSLIRSQIESGHQAFIIYPLVEESENSETKAATEEYLRLQEEIFPKYKIGLLHGRLKPEEKEQVMSEFQSGENHILVSTSVIEVGVDVQNATVMLIEGANRFGLAQLHQFRGRVGRGSDQSYCILIPDSADDMDNERLRVLSETNDGFLLAEKDLEQRGPGQFLGTRQSGYSEFQLANLTKIEVIEQAQRLAHDLISQDPDLSKEDHQLLSQAVKASWTPHNADIS